MPTGRRNLGAREFEKLDRSRLPFVGRQREHDILKFARISGAKSERYLPSTRDVKYFSFDRKSIENSVTDV